MKSCCHYPGRTWVTWLVISNSLVSVFKHSLFIYSRPSSHNLHGAAILPAEAWRHLSVPAWTIDLELRAAGNSAGSLTPPSCTTQNHSVPLITRCLNLPHVTSQCNVARDWVRYAPFCFCCASCGRKWGPQHHRFITGPPTPPTKRQNGGLLSYIARWYKSSGSSVVNGQPPADIVNKIDTVVYR